MEASPLPASCMSLECWHVRPQTGVHVQDLIKFGNSTREYVLIHEKREM